jgi:hypothetical protein
MTFKLRVDQLRAARFNYQQVAKKKDELERTYASAKKSLETLDPQSPRAIEAAKEARAEVGALPELIAKMDRAKVEKIDAMAAPAEQVRLEIEKWRDAESASLSEKIHADIAKYSPDFTQENEEKVSPGRAFAQTSAIVRAVHEAAKVRLSWPSRSRSQAPDKYDQEALEYVGELLRVADLYFHQNESFWPSDWGKATAAA